MPSVRPYPLEDGMRVFVVERPGETALSLRYLNRAAGSGAHDAPAGLAVLVGDALWEGSILADGSATKGLRVTGRAPRVVTGPLDTRITLGVHRKALTPDSGLLDVRMAVDNHRLADALEDLRGRFRSLRTEAVGREQLRIAQDLTLAGLELTTVTGIAEQLTWLDSMELEPDWLDATIARLSTLTPEDIQAAAHAHLALERSVLVAAGDYKDAIWNLRNAKGIELQIVPLRWP